MAERSAPHNPESAPERAANAATSVTKSLPWGACRSAGRAVTEGDAVGPVRARLRSISLTMPRRFEPQRLRRLIRGIEDLIAVCREAEARAAQPIAAVPEDSRFSARNLSHYLGVRQRNLIPLQEELSRLGLSSLGRMEARVAATLGAVRLALRRLAGLPAGPGGSPGPESEFALGGALVNEHAEELLGHAGAPRYARIMVTMPSEAAGDAELMKGLLDEGMEVMRINCAHDDPETWFRMVADLRASEAATGKSCRIAFDLAGPKLRTGPAGFGPRIIRWKPRRNERGEVIEPASIRFYPKLQPTPAPPERGIPLDPDGFMKIRAGSRLRLEDARGRRRELHVVTARDKDVIAECDHTAYVEPGTRIEIVEHSHRIGTAVVESFAAPPRPIHLSRGDRLTVFLGRENGRDAQVDADGRLVAPARIGCDFAGLFSHCRPGDPILFDDGKIRVTVVEPRPGELIVEIGQTSREPGRLGAEKGINVPETPLSSGALTEQDLADLGRVVDFADTVSLSFVRGPEDVAALVRELDELGADQVGIILKIETRAAFENLGAILLEALRHPPVAVMIARGDLGVEVGFERLAEVQEEMLWICEAAHVPVIWATQVLDTLAKTGIATRAEVTDAAMSGRAECVMLNKGPHIIPAVRTLSDILTRMEGHQVKKTARMRRLNVANLRADR